MDKEDIREMLIESLSWHMSKNGENIAIISDDQSITYKELYQLIGNVVVRLKDAEIDLSLIVGIRFEDPIMHMVTSLALFLMGATQTSINFNDTLNVQKKMIDRINIDILIGDRDDTADLCTETIILDKDLLSVSPKKHINIAKEYHTHFSDTQDRTALIIMGSGTTGTPKMMGIGFTLLAYLIRRDITMRSFEVGEKHYSISSIDYYTAKRRSLGCLLSGVTVILPKKRPEQIVSFCKEYSIDHLSLTTVQAMQILKEEEQYTKDKKLRLKNVKSLFVGTSPISETLRTEITNTLTKNLYIAYGSQEFGEATIATPDDQKLYPETVGRPCSDVIVQIVDDKGHLCENGTIGNIRLSSRIMMHSYLHNTKTSQKVFTPEGFYPGDMGQMTKDGLLIFKGRKDDMMIFNGENIYPREIEILLESHPNVIEAAAFPFRMKENTDIPFAAVAVSNSIKEIELLKWCSNEMGWRGPKKIFFFKKLPRNSAGKINKKELLNVINIRMKLDRERLNFVKQKIPKIIHQSYHTKRVPDSLKDNIAKLKSVNPEWEYRFYDDEDQKKFIAAHYAPAILEAYKSINPLYGAARADLFRYLLIYKMGGVWLDIKSSIESNLSEQLKNDDLFLLSQWQNKMGEPFQGYGLFPELEVIPGGEFQQWHIISAPKNPFLKAVIQNVITNINSYTPEKFGVGREGVLRTTGSIAYTKAIAPLLQYYPHRYVDIMRDMKFKWTIFSNRYEHRKLFKIHYSELKEPVIS